MESGRPAQEDPGLALPIPARPATNDCLLARIGQTDLAPPRPSSLTEPAFGWEWSAAKRGRRCIRHIPHPAPRARASGKSSARASCVDVPPSGVHRGKSSSAAIGHWPAGSAVVGTLWRSSCTFSVPQTCASVARCRPSRRSRGGAVVGRAVLSSQRCTCTYGPHRTYRTVLGRLDVRAAALAGSLTFSRNAW